MILNTYVRVRPFHKIHPQMKRIDRNCIIPNPNNIQIDCNGLKKNQQVYKIKDCLWSHSGFVDKDGVNVGQSEKYIDQKQVFQKMENSVNYILKGNNVAFITTGTSCGGKSYTMFGDQRNQGIFPQFIDELFQKLNDGDQVFLSMITLDKNDPLDLLVQDQTKQKLELQSNENLYQVLNLTEQEIKTKNEAIAFLKKCTNNQKNHSIMNSDRYLNSVILYLKLKIDGQMKGLATFMDLSSGARIRGFGLSGDQLKSTIQNNKIIVGFNNLLVALSQTQKGKQGTLPFRESTLNKLTYTTLKQSITNIIFCINASDQEISESQNILYIAEKLCQISQNQIQNQGQQQQQQQQQIELQQEDVDIQPQGQYIKEAEDQQYQQFIQYNLELTDEDAQRLKDDN